MDLRARGQWTGTFSPKRRRRRAQRASTALAVLLTAVGLAPLTGVAPAGAVGAAAVSTTVDPVHGFPQWYQDTTGTRVTPCLNPTDRFCLVTGDAFYDPTLPQVFPTNFPSELFYTVTDSQRIATNGCSGTKKGNVSIRIALEAAFTAGHAVPGDQMTFGRVRLIVTGGLCANSTYTATHPFGQITFTTDGNGALAKNQGTTDTGCAPVAPKTCDFSLALESDVAKSFLRWDPAVAPAAPAGYLGDPNTAHRITGSTYVPPGESAPANYFRITGPKLNQPLQTNLFLVSGKVAGPLSADPSSLDFGGQQSGTTSTEKKIVVTNLADRTVTPSAATVVGTDPAAFTVTSDTCAGTALARDATCTVGVTFAPTAPGTPSATLQIAHDATPGPFELALRGTTTAPDAAAAATVTPAVLDFGNQRLGVQSALRTVTVASTGTAPLQVGTVALQGPDPGEFRIVNNTCSGQPVAVGSSCAVEVAFLASKVQASVAHLNIPSNDPVGPLLVDLAGTGYGGLAKVSPTTAAWDGYPDWYQDERGIRLAQCIDPEDPYCTVLPGGTFAGTTPLTFPGNFPDEFFYTVADSEQIPLPDCNGNRTGSGFVRTAVEGAFAGLEVKAGEQIVFGRVRVRADGVCPGTTYRFVHPYGTVEVTADSRGRVTDTQDIGCLTAPCAFADAVLSPVLGGVLRWDPDRGAPAPAGYLGDAVSLHRVVGSPYVEPGQTVPADYFKVYRGNTLVNQTNLFTVMGKLAGPLVADPPDATFGDVDTGSTTTRTITLHNEGVDPLKVNGLSATGAQAADFTVGADQCTGTVLEPAASCTADVGFSPLGTGVRSAALRVDHTGMNNPLSVPLQGVGVAGGGLAALSVDRSSLTFEQLQLNRSSVSQTVTVSNVGGTAPLELDPVTLGGTDPGDFSVRQGTCTTTVAPGESCAVTVTFTPTAAGHRTATVQLSAVNAQPGTVSVGLAGDGSTGGAAVSSLVRSSDGFPAWYQDSNGVRLEPCLDPGDPRCIVLPDAGFDPAQPVAFPGNYPPELFYALADSEVTPTAGCDGGPGGTAMLRLALEGSFAGGSAQAGQQIVFGRVRITADGLCPTTPYTFTTPYGPLQATTDNSGAVRSTRDVGCGGAPCAFGDALQSPVTDGFVRWAPGVGADAPAGYLGDGVSYHRIVGGTYLDPATGAPVNRFEVVAPDGTTVAATSKFLVSGKLATGLVADAVDFGDQALQSTTTRDITFTNIGAQPVAVGGTAIVGPDRSFFTDTGLGTCAGAVLQADTTCRVRLEFRPTDAVDYVATVQVLGSGGTVLGTAGVRGHGLAAAAPRASVSVTSVDFGSQGVGATASRTVSVTNTGSAALEVTRPSFSGPAAADYSATPGSGCGAVAPGATCVIDVAFTPTTAGTRNAVLTVVSNDPGPAPTIAVTGVGSSAALSLKSSVLDFGKQKVGRSTTKSVTVTNSGTSPLVITAVAVDNPVDFRVGLGTCTSPVQPGRTCSIAVTFTATGSAGPRSGSVTFTSNAANKPSLRVTATVL